MMNLLLNLLALFAPFMLIGAAVKGVNRTLMDTPTPANRLKSGRHDGRVKVTVDTYEASAVAAASTIDMCGTLPTGAKILEVILITDDLSDDATLEVGDDEDPNRYITATICTTANQVTRLNAIDGQDYEVDMTISSTPDNQIVITTAVSAITGTIKLVVLYTID